MTKESRKNEQINPLNLQCEIDAVARMVQTAITMWYFMGIMMNMVKRMGQAIKAMDSENASLTLPPKSGRGDRGDVVPHPMSSQPNLP